ncbi:MAG: glyceraldehyde 3-phosphate dehydrogenase NAD-binding domain-containing protein [Candidatus Andersenbacteria bacterium]
MLRVAINGCGRIGGAVAKLLLLGEHEQVRLVAINDHAEAADLQDYLQRDSVYGRFALPIRLSGRDLIVAGSRVQTFMQDDPRKLPWKRLKIDAVVEATGAFASDEGARLHLQAGAQRVLVSTAPKAAVGQVGYLVCGTDAQNRTEQLISHGSCTTSAVAPVLCMLREQFSIRAWTLFAVQSVTHSQVVVDKTRGQARRRRQALDNIIPITLDTDRAVPHLFTGPLARYAGQGVRVPTSIVHLAVLTVQLKEHVTPAELNQHLRALSKQLPWRGTVRFSNEALVSQDLRQTTESATIDASMTKVAGDSLAQIGIWYDNEWAFAQRMVDVLGTLAQTA